MLDLFRRHWLSRVSAAICILLLAACGGGSSATNKSTKVGGTFTYGTRIPNPNNPAKSGGGNLWNQPAYEALLGLNLDGTVKADLATSFGWVGTGNQTYDLTLRTDVKFSDGAPLTAQSVVDSITYFKSAGGPYAGQLPLASVTAISANQVEIKLTKPLPILPFWLAETLGMIIGPSGLRDPKSLDTTMDGAGPYLLDASQSQPNDHSVFLPNPNYYDKSRIKWSKIVVKLIADANSRLAAIQSGQIDMADGTLQTADAAASSGFNVVHAAGMNETIWFMDTTGSINKAFGDVRVRQALNYAIDRAAVTKALVGKYGQPTDESSAPGFDLYDKNLENRYPYDPTKAKQLLADAGYPNGFSMTLLSGPDIGAIIYDLVAQAVADQLSKIGVKVNIKSISVVQYFTGGWYSGKYEAGIQNQGFATLDAVSQWASFTGPKATLNILHSTDPQASILMDQVLVADPKQRPALARQVEARLLDLARFMSIFNFDVIYLVDKRVGGMQIASTNLVGDYLTWYPK